MFEAEQLSVGRKCAVKVLTPKSVDESTTEQRFRQEAQTTSRLTHPNSIVLYDFGRDEELDVLWLAMELLDGETLKSRINREGPFSVERTLHICRQMAESLHEAHQMGLVHRDIKPGNVMLLDRSGDPDFVKVIDFGIAKIVRETLAPGQDMTQTGHILGTPKYMAPEQIRDTRVDGRADMYAVATVVYAMLTTEVPFSGGSPMEIASRQITERPPKIRDISADLDVGHQFEAVLLQGLSKNPDKRFADMLAFVDALEEAALGSSTSTPMPNEKLASSSTPSPQATPSEDEASAESAPDTREDVAPTTEQIDDGSLPTAEVGHVDDLDVDEDEDDIGGQTLDTVAVSTSSVTGEEFEERSDTIDARPAPEPSRSESTTRRRNLVPVFAGIAAVFFAVALGVWWFSSADDDASDETPARLAESEQSSEPNEPDPPPAPTPDAGDVGDEIAADTGSGAGTTAPEPTPSGKPGGDAPDDEDEPASTEEVDDDENGEEASAEDQADASDEEIEEPPPAWVSLTVRGIPWGELYVDGRHLGSAPSARARVKEGRREFVLKQNGKVRAKRIVDVSPGYPKIVRLVAD